MSETRGPLTPYEIASITAGVPASGDAYIDALITQGLRVKIAIAILEGMVAHNSASVADPKKAIQLADALLDEFRHKQP